MAASHCLPGAQLGMHCEAGRGWDLMCWVARQDAERVWHARQVYVRGGRQSNMLHQLRVHLHVRHRLDCGFPGLSEAMACAGS